MKTSEKIKNLLKFNDILSIKNIAKKLNANLSTVSMAIKKLKSLNEVYMVKCREGRTNRTYISLNQIKRLPTVPNYQAPPKTNPNSDIEVQNSEIEVQKNIEVQNSEIEVQKNIEVQNPEIEVQKNIEVQNIPIPKTTPKSTNFEYSKSTFRNPDIVDLMGVYRFLTGQPYPRKTGTKKNIIANEIIEIIEKAKV